MAGEMLNLMRRLETGFAKHPPAEPALLHELQHRFKLVLDSYSTDLDYITRLYLDNHHDPPLPRNSPRIAGMIAWARNLLEHVERPMQTLRSHSSHVTRPECRNLVRKYNKIVRTLIAFEAQWHEAWMSSLDSANAGFSATLLVEHNERLHVNYDPRIVEVWSIL